MKTDDADLRRGAASAPASRSPAAASRSTFAGPAESGELHRLLVESVADYAIFALDPAGHVLTWNAGAQRAKGYAPHEIIGRHFSVFYPQARIDEGFPDYELREAARAGRFEDEGWRLRKDGSRFWASVVITALRDEAGTLVGFAKVTRDLTERRAAQQRALDDARRLAAEEGARLAAEQRAQELRALTEQLRTQAMELQERRREAEEANRAKSEFLAAMSHELRTPLNAIGGYAELMELELSGPVTARQREQLERIRRSQQYLLGIINDILNFSRIEAGQISYDFGVVAVGDVMESVAQMIAPQADGRGLALGLEAPDPELAVWADRAKVEQILLNLLSNAVKFTEAGGRVTLSARREGPRVRLTVRDTGIGIPADRIHDIFEPFVQVGRTLTSFRDGTGLGLAISRDLARAMHGELTAESTPGAGSLFTLTLPASEPSR